MTTLDINPEFELAFNYVTNTRQPIFLTGKAGTGKTTFLKYLREHSTKNMLIAAPTGVAAINAGGVTLHSLFTLPFAPFIPEAKGWGSGDASQDKNSLLAKLRYNKEKITLLRNLDLLIIDEISMVRADVLDMIDLILRTYRRAHHLPFGGVQVLFIGDLFQLPPVVKQEEWDLLKNYYDSEFFFNARVMAETKLVCIELVKIYRQKEEKFINMLNKVRNNNMSEQDLELLNERYQADIYDDKYITLTSHNKQANAINEHHLNELGGKTFIFKAAVTGEFSEYSYPCELELKIKKGAKVMFTKNDVGANRKYFNGKIGVVTHVDADSIDVQCEGDDDIIEVTQDTWRNVRYKLNHDNNKVEEEELGSFAQMPLRHAWAITIHKSQGLTFNYTAIDAARSFSGGQLYVALSRCTSLNGIILLSKIPATALMVHEKVIAFTAQYLQQNNEAELASQTQAFQYELLQDLYSFAKEESELRSLQKMMADNRAFFSADNAQYLNSLSEFVKNLSDTGRKFENELAQIYTDNNKLLERCAKANVYFSNQVQHCLSNIMAYNWNMESKQVSSAVAESLLLLYTSLFTKQHLFDNTKDVFNTATYFDIKNNMRVPRPALKVYTINSKEKAPSGTHHPLLYMSLADVRNELVASSGLPVFRIANKDTIIEMSNYLPANGKELEYITGFGPTKVKQFGDEFLDVISDYVFRNNLQSNMDQHPKFLKSATKTERLMQKNTDDKIKKEHGITATVFKSLEMLENGFDIARIAAERGMAASTIEGHLAICISHGKLTAAKILPADKILSIAKTFANNPEAGSITQIKELLDDTFTFGQIRLVSAQMKYDLEK
jgi:PIF1-like helicase/Helix-turn-helix domain/HRDC domain